ncbi:hypothetical protein GCM10027596_02640 [Nocardioides korecus]
MAASSSSSRLEGPDESGLVGSPPTEPSGVSPHEKMNVPLPGDGGQAQPQLPAPGDLNDISEDARPGDAAPLVASPRTPDDDDRRYIAWIMLAILGIAVAVGLINWCVRGLSADQMQGFQMIFTPLVTLVASVLGFYFSRKK